MILKELVKVAICTRKSFTINVDSMNWTFHNDIDGDDDDDDDDNDYHGNFRGNRKQGFAWKGVKRF